MIKEDVIEFYKALRHEKETELRAINPETKEIKNSFVHNEEELLDFVKKYDGKYNLYIGVNERKRGHKESKHITKVKIIPVDIDCINKPASEKDLVEAQNTATKIIIDGEKQGFKKPLCSYSGNGYQLFFCIPGIEIKNNWQEVQEKIQEFIRRLIEKYSTKIVKIDQVGDLARIMRIPGTFNLKSKTVSRLILSEVNEDSLLQDYILSLKTEKSKVFSISSELREKIKKDEEITKLFNAEGEAIRKFASRSEAELSLICRLIQIGLNKEEIFKVMAGCKIGKWQEANIQYRELTYKKALEIITKEKRNFKIEKAGKVFDKAKRAEIFGEIQPYFYDKSGLWWLWNHKNYCWERVDDVDILNMIHEATGIDIISTKNRNEILNSLKQEGRKRMPKKMKKTWIQFKDKVIDVETEEEFRVSPEYFAANPIPWALHKDKLAETPTMDRIFKEWVGDNYVKTLYEIIAYCLLPSYPIHRLFCFIGEGLNGKSCFLRLLTKFVGKKNVTSTELDTLIKSRFEVARLYKKLVCIMGETNFSQVEKTSIIKKITGQDTIGFEYKNKTPFEDTNYAKVLIATNNLPTTTDKTIGFYRRWLIIDFPNRFNENKDILDEIPNEEYESLALKSVQILKDLLKRRKFTSEGSIEERAKRYEEKSNPFDKFINEFCDISDVNGYITKSEFERRLNEWLKENRFRSMSNRTINKLMREKEIHEDKEYIEWWREDTEVKKQVRVWRGIKWREQNM